MALCPENKRHDIQHLLSESIKSSTREFIFRLDVHKLLVGNLVQEYVEQQATRLLRELATEQSDSNRAIFFIAYDVGAVVVKMVIIPLHVCALLNGMLAYVSWLLGPFSRI